MTNPDLNQPTDPDIPGPVALHPQPTATRHASLLAEARRQALRDLLRREGLTLTELARRAGMCRANTLFNFMGGRASSLSANTLAKFRVALPHADLMGLIAPDSQAPGPTRVLPPVSSDQASASSDEGQPPCVLTPVSRNPTTDAWGLDPVSGSRDPLMHRLRRLEQENLLLKRLLAHAWVGSAR